MKQPPSQRTETATATMTPLIGALAIFADAAGERLRYAPQEIDPDELKRDTGEAVDLLDRLRAKYECEQARRPGDWSIEEDRIVRAMHVLAFDRAVLCRDSGRATLDDPDEATESVERLVMALVAHCRRVGIDWNALSRETECLYDAEHGVGEGGA